jgi:hypothetical protein
VGGGGRGGRGWAAAAPQGQLGWAMQMAALSLGSPEPPRYRSVWHEPSRRLLGSRQPLLLRRAVAQRCGLGLQLVPAAGVCCGPPPPTCSTSCCFSSSGRGLWTSSVNLATSVCLNAGAQVRAGAQAGSEGCQDGAACGGRQGHWHAGQQQAQRAPARRFRAASAPHIASCSTHNI